MVNLFRRFNLRLRLYIIYNFINYFLLAVLSQKEKPWTAIEKKPHATFRIEVVWVYGGNLYEGTSKYKEAFPCILKVDVLTNSS